MSFSTISKKNKKQKKKNKKKNGRGLGVAPTRISNEDPEMWSHRLFLLIKHSEYIQSLLQLETTSQYISSYAIKISLLIKYIKARVEWKYIQEIEKKRYDTCTAVKHFSYFFFYLYNAHNYCIMQISISQLQSE